MTNRFTNMPLQLLSTAFNINQKITRPLLHHSRSLCLRHGVVQARGRDRTLDSRVVFGIQEVVTRDGRQIMLDDAVEKSKKTSLGTRHSLSNGDESSPDSALPQAKSQNDREVGHGS